METIVTFAIPIFLGLLLLKLLMTPMKWFFKLVLHAACGFLCLWLLNSISSYTGILLPINTATVLTSGIFGITGILVIVLLELI